MGMRQAINAKCRDCIHDPAAPGNWRQQVDACTLRSCALWEYRPKSTAKLESTAILAPFQTEPPAPLGVVAGRRGSAPEHPLSIANAAQQ